eukprot:scaffold132514_cov63-Phaeocystis_antarctica.AAC.2
MPTNVSFFAKCAAPRAANTKPRGTEPRLPRVPNHPSGRALSMAERTVTRSAVPTSKPPLMPPIQSFCSSGGLAEIRMAGSGRGTSNGSTCILERRTGCNGQVAPRREARAGSMKLATEPPWSSSRQRRRAMGRATVPAPTGTERKIGAVPKPRRGLLAANFYA